MTKEYTSGSNSINPLYTNYQRDKFFFKSFTDLDIEEAKLVLRWRNHDNVRKWMFNNNIIIEEEHLNFIKTLHQSKDKAYWLVYKNDKPMAVVYFVNYDKKSCEWGIYINPNSIGSGVGLDVQFYFLNILFNAIHIENLYAYVDKQNVENLNIQKLFNFEQHPDVEYIDNSPYVKLELKKQNWESLDKEIKQFKINQLLNRK